MAMAIFYTGQTETLRREEWSVSSLSPGDEAGDGHERGCSDALAIAFGSSPGHEHAALVSHHPTRLRNLAPSPESSSVDHSLKLTVEGS